MLAHHPEGILRFASPVDEPVLVQVFGPGQLKRRFPAFSFFFFFAVVIFCEEILKHRRNFLGLVEYVFSRK
jgi:hypothetical protein